MTLLSITYLPGGADPALPHDGVAYLTLIQPAEGDLPAQALVVTPEGDVLEARDATLDEIAAAAS